MNKSDRLKKELELPEFQHKYEEACLEVEKTLRQVDAFILEQQGRNFINAVEWRVKTPDSCISKLKRKGLALTVKNTEEKINDIAGVRVICSFLDDIYTLCRKMMEVEEFEVVKRKDYVRKPKSSGYQSLHLILRVPVDDDEQETVKVEVQFRTQAMHFWASVEHEFVYKKDDIYGERIEEDLLKCAKDIYKIDKRMMQIRNRIQELEKNETT